MHFPLVYFFYSKERSVLEEMLQAATSKLESKGNQLYDLQLTHKPIIEERDALRDQLKLVSNNAEVARQRQRLELQQRLQVGVRNIT